jgi:hypothetical protein
MRTAIAASMLASASGICGAEDYAVREFQIEDVCAGCAARIVVRWDQNGIKCQVPVEKPSGNRVTIDLTDRLFSKKNIKTGCILVPGGEVWASVEPAAGKTADCRPPNARARFDPNGGTARFRLSGDAKALKCAADGTPDTVYSAR